MKKLSEPDLVVWLLSLDVMGMAECLLRARIETSEVLWNVFELFLVLALLVVVVLLHFLFPCH